MPAVKFCLVATFIPEAKSYTSKLGIKRAKFTLSANNLFTITKYKGLDPGVGGAADTGFGIDVGNYPVSRSFNASINLTF